MQSEKYLACYIDVLGQKAAYQSLRRCAPDLISFKEWDEIMRVSGESRWLLHQFTNICQEISDQAKSFYGLLSNIDHSIFSTITVDDFINERPKYEEEWGVCPFSDGILMYISCTHLWAGLIFTIWLSRLAEQMVRLHAQKISVRGVISVGEAFPVRGGTIVGNLVDNLQRYEGNVAFYSRIVVAPEFRDYIFTIINKRENGELVDPVFWDYRDLLDSDFDGILRLDYLSEHMLKLLSFEGRDRQYVRNCVDAYKNISRSAGKFEKAVAQSSFDVSKSDIAWKYRYLQAYYAARIGLLIKASQFDPSNTATSGFVSTSMMASPINKPEEYYVCYLKVERMNPLPAQEDIPNATVHTIIGMDSCDSVTARILSRFIGQFNINRNEWLHNAYIHILWWIKTNGQIRMCFVKKHQNLR